jgi:uncharacterized membrane protein
MNLRSLVMLFWGFLIQSFVLAACYFVYGDQVNWVMANILGISLCIHSYCLFYLIKRRANGIPDV